MAAEPAELSGRAWLAALPDALAAQRRVLTGLVDRCEEWPQVTLFMVGCSLGRGAGDALSDIDAALGIGNEPRTDCAERVRAAEAMVDSEPEPEGETPAAYAVTGEQVREWAFLGWSALIDADKYLRRNSLWEAHNRLHEARHQIWALWAAANGALYPWHGLCQVLDHDPENLPPGIESTVAGLDAADLRRAARASVLATVSAAAARRQPADLPEAMAAYVTEVITGLAWDAPSRPSGG